MAAANLVMDYIEYSTDIMVGDFETRIKYRESARYYILTATQAVATANILSGQIIPTGEKDESSFEYIVESGGDGFKEVGQILAASLKFEKCVSIFLELSNYSRRTITDLIGEFKAINNAVGLRSRTTPNQAG